MSPSPGPGQETVGIEEVEDALPGDPSQDRRGHAEVDERQLMGIMGVRADGDPGAGFCGEPKQVDLEILPVGVAVDLQGYSLLGGGREHPGPVRP